MFQILTTTLMLIIGFSAQAFPLPKGSPAELHFAATASSNYDFEGIVGLSNCSGSLVRLESSKDEDKALVFTNGHCLETGFTKPGEYVAHKPSSRTVNLFNSKAQIVGKLQAIEIVYSAMTKTDLTIYRMKESYAEILTKFNIRPLILSSAHPTRQTQIEIISGYWRKGYSCAIDDFVTQLNEAGWLFSDSIRFSRPGCETVGGTSGSPILQAGTRTMIGINNTGNEDGLQCTMNNPCEIDEDGQVHSEEGLSYGQQTFWVYSCLNEQNDIDLTIKGCLLHH